VVTTDEGVPCNFWKKDDIGEEGEWRGVNKERTKGLSSRYGGTKFATGLRGEAQKIAESQKLGSLLILGRSKLKKRKHSNF
jgi:hypothetical protein